MTINLNLRAEDRGGDVENVGGQEDLDREVLQNLVILGFSTYVSKRSIREIWKARSEVASYKEGRQRRAY